MNVVLSPINCNYYNQRLWLCRHFYDGHHQQFSCHRYFYGGGYFCLSKTNNFLPNLLLLFDFPISVVCYRFFAKFSPQNYKHNFHQPYDRLLYHFVAFVDSLCTYYNSEVCKLRERGVYDSIT